MEKIKFLKNRNIFYQLLHIQDKRVGGQNLKYKINTILDFENYFGFKQVKFHNDFNSNDMKLTVKQKQFILDISHSLQDLADILNINVDKIGLNKFLNIDFTLNLSTPLYDNKSKTLYFNKNNSVGCIGLFYFQGLLDYISITLLKDNQKNNDFINNLYYIDDIADQRIKDALKELRVNLLKKEQLKIKEKVLICKQVNQKQKMFARQFLEDYVNNIYQLRKHYVDEYKNNNEINFLKKINECDIYLKNINRLLEIKNIDKLYKEILNIEQNNLNLNDGVKKSLILNLAPIQDEPFYLYKMEQYYINSDYYEQNLYIDALDKKIVTDKKNEWAVPLEMLKRAFICYLFDKLKKFNRVNNYLTSPCDNKIYEIKFKNLDKLFRPFACQKEREILNKNFDKFILALTFNKELNLTNRYLDFYKQQDILLKELKNPDLIFNIEKYSTFTLTINNNLLMNKNFLLKGAKLGCEQEVKEILKNKIYESVLYTCPNYYMYALNCLKRNNYDLTAFFERNENIKELLIYDERLFSSLPEKMQHNKNLIIDVIKENINLLEYVDPVLLTGKKNAPFINKLVSHNGLAINFLGYKERKNKDLIYTAIKQNPMAYYYIDPQLAENVDIINFALKLDNSIIYRIKPSIFQKIKNKLNLDIIENIQNLDLS